MFQSTPPHAGRRGSVRTPNGRATFQSTPPARGATELVAWGAGDASRFNPRPRTGGDSLHDRSVCVVAVSIHAPARGATRHDRLHDQRQLRVSIHAPARGATRDPVIAGAPDGTVSIHAPARGATRRSAGWRRSPCSFNPRPRTGGDAPSGYDPGGPSSFNPRPRTGATRPDRHADRARGVSIHAPARGATRQPVCRLRPPVSVSIHAPARGATPAGARRRRRRRVSIHAPARGATRRRGDTTCSRPFQSTPPHGGRRPW